MEVAVKHLSSCVLAVRITAEHVMQKPHESHQCPASAEVSNRGEEEGRGESPRDVER